ncbi:nicotinate phosphoribosyltransferase [Gottschalkia acidurici]|nr:nicotinate phosphoribosyltransferase [Gottschalkia acidurici]
MSVFNGKRLPIEIFKMTEEIIDKIRSGWYSDEYFNNTLRVLTSLSKEGYKFGDKENDLNGIVSVREVENGDIIVEMQFFTRRKPFSLVVGVDEALAILKVGTGYRDEDGIFINTFEELEIEAIQDGNIVSYDGNPLNIKPVLKIRGKYRYFGHLETTILGVLSVPTRVATNVYNVLMASKGKQILFFPARFDHYKMQGIDGYAYWIAVQRYKMDFGIDAKASVSTHEQGDWWGGKAGGTISHSTIACFLGNTAETMVQFARLMPIEVPRIALVDFHNDCIGESIKVIKAMWNEFWKNWRIGNKEEAERYRLFGVRPDTSQNMRDESVEPLFVKELDNGVTPRLVYNIRKAIDAYWEELVKDYNYIDMSEATALAKVFCNDIKIAVTGGFNADKISRFEEINAPVDIYGVGSSLLENSSCNGTNNDYTADIVRVKVNSKFYPLSKVGRSVCYNEDLEIIDTNNLWN